MKLLLVIHVIITLAMIGVILIQRSEGGGLGLGGGGSGANGMFTARGAANFLTRATAILATLFMVNCVVMTIVASRQIKTEQSIISQ